MYKGNRDRTRWEVWKATCLNASQENALKSVETFPAINKIDFKEMAPNHIHE